MFRAPYFAEKGALALFAFFVILIFLPPILGPSIHVLEHTPRDRRPARARQDAADLRSRWLNGDVSALQDYYAYPHTDRR